MSVLLTALSSDISDSRLPIQRTSFHSTPRLQIHPVLYGNTTEHCQTGGVQTGIKVLIFSCSPDHSTSSPTAEHSNAMPEPVEPNPFADFLVGMKRSCVTADFNPKRQEDIQALLRQFADRTVRLSALSDKFQELTLGPAERVKSLDGRSMTLQDATSAYGALRSLDGACNLTLDKIDGASSCDRRFVWGTEQLKEYDEAKQSVESHRSIVFKLYTGLAPHINRMRDLKGIKSFSDHPLPNPSSG